MGRTRDVSKILTSNTSILTLASASATYAPISSTGLIKLANSGFFIGENSKSFNNIFTSSYNIYKIYYYFAYPSGNGIEIRLRLRSNGSDIQGTNDYVTVLNGYSSSNTSKSTTTTTSYFFLNNYAADFGVMEITLERPLAASNTRGMLVNSIGYDGTYPARVGGGRHVSTTSADGFTIFANTGTVGGIIDVYGLKI
jgi:hypothetical protein